MYPGHWGQVAPERPASVMADTGEVITYSELNARSCKLARLMRTYGLEPGDHIALFMENHPRYHEVIWAALRSGLVVTTVNSYLTAPEAGYIIDDCGARVLITSTRLADVAAELPTFAPQCERWLMVDGTALGYESYEASIESVSDSPLDEEPLGDFMLYSSGTTGRPKGVSRFHGGGNAADGLPLLSLICRLFSIDRSTTYLSPAPLYHSAPLGFTTAVQSAGGTTVIMPRFDPEAALRAIERYQVTHSQWVPTMFSRMLKLPRDVRDSYDTSSQRVVIHAAAPCPQSVKHGMFEWWGPIIHEYYGGTEPSGLTYCSPDEWLARPGTVGKAVRGAIHVCDEVGIEVSAGTVGTIYFGQRNNRFEYHNAPELSRTARHPHHDDWSTLFDMGRVDEDGYLYLVDRATFMIISGGVNIYPQEVEDCLIAHPQIDDVAVIGVPNADFGEEVKAVAQLRPGVEANAEVAAEILEWARARLAPYKCPRSVDFEEQLPRLPTGKLYKRLLRDRYWGNSESRIV